MRTTLRNLALAVLGLGLFVACSDDVQPVEKEPNTTKLLSEDPALRQEGLKEAATKYGK